MSGEDVIIGVISDTHLTGYDEHLDCAVREHFASADMIFHAGDLVDLSVLQLFAPKDVRAVRGNMDNDRASRDLPPERVMSIGGFTIALIHGWGPPDGLDRKLAARFPDADCIVFGHTHRPMNQRIGKTLLFNPGSAVDKRFAPFRSLGLLEIGQDIRGRIIAIE